MKRTPPPRVQRVLRQEVGFGCPIPVDGVPCGNPYLTWHHFDPPWNIRQHHNSNGMIALCSNHHNQANGKHSSWTKAQLQSYKRVIKQSQIKGQFAWMRQRLLGVLGSNLVYECPTLLYCCNQPVISFERDNDDYLLVNLRMPRTNLVADVVMEHNNWVMSTDMLDIECPPNGRLLAVTYPNGDKLQIEFRSLETLEDASRLLPTSAHHLSGLEFPLASVEFQLKVAALGIDIDSTRRHLMYNSIYRNCIARNSPIGFAFGETSGGGACFSYVARQ